MREIADILDQSVPFDPAGDFDALLKSIPARWSVCLLANADGRPVQFLSARNLRDSIKNRLAERPADAPSKRADYRQIVRQLRWRRVDGEFEADWVYHDVARQIFPDTYRGMVGFRPAWFLHIDPDAKFPRFTKTIDLSPKPGLIFGPVADKHAAARLIELIEDAFDLCRYHNILIEAPHGRACPYKEMGKCPAPCDGSISLDQYHQMIDLSIAALADPAPVVLEHQQRMAQAAAELRFESAAKIQQFIEQLSRLGAGPFRHVRPLENFAYVSLQPGPKPGLARLFLILGGEIEEIAGIIVPIPTTDSLDLIHHTLSHSSHPSNSSHTSDPSNFSHSFPGNKNRWASPPAKSAKSLNPHKIERLGIITRHLLSPRRTGGLFIPLADLSASTFAAALRGLRKQKPPEETPSLDRELQAIDEADPIPTTPPSGQPT